MKKTFSLLFIYIFIFTAMFSTGIEVFGANQIGRVNCTALNVRSGAGTTYSKIATLYDGAQVTITGSANDSSGDKWYKISFSDSGTSKIGYAYAEYITITSSGTTSSNDSAFEKYMTSQGFPDSYKPMLRELHKKYPKWIFKAQNLDIDWNTALTQECVVGRNLVHAGAPASWKSMEKGAYNFNGGYWYGLDGSWVAASKEIIAYYLDPRNFINDPSIFMFENLSYNSSVHTIDGVKSILANSFMKGNFVAPDTKKTYSYAQTFMDAAKQSGVSPYHLASRCLNEQGVNGAPQSLGTVPGYKNYFNFFDVNAYATSTMTAQQMGCKYASTTNPTYLLPWTNQYKSIVGGSIFLGGGYINKGQDTLYLQKFDMVDGGNGYYYHQYMTCVFGQENEAAFMKRAYSQAMLNSAMEFKIPVYKNMPNSLYKKPTSTGDNNNFLKSLSISGYKLNQTFDKYTMNYTLTSSVTSPTVTVNAATLSSGAKISGTGNVSLKLGSNKVNIKVTAPSGVVRTYTITINRVADPTYIDNVTGFKVTATDHNAIKLGWNQISDAEGYVVYRYDFSKNQWLRINKGKNPGTFLFCRLNSGTTYKFAVRAYKTYNGKEVLSSSYPQITASTNLETVSGFKGTPTSNTLKLTWNKLSNSDGYVIYRYDNAKKDWVRLPLIKSNVNSFTLTNLSSGAKYKYAIRGYKIIDGKEILSESFPQLEEVTKLSTVTNFKGSSTTNSVNLTWNKISNADGYIIYRYDTAKKTWVRLPLIKSNVNSVTLTKLSSGVKYKYAIRAYKTVDGKEVLSENYPQLEVVTKSPAITKLPTVDNFKGTSTTNSVNLTWNKISNAYGYIIYRYDTVKKSWVRLPLIKSNVNSVTLTKLSSGVKYKYAIRAYKTVDGKEIISESYPQLEITTQKI